MSNNQPPDRVPSTDKPRSPERARRLGKALIALARAQLEAEARAQTTTTLDPAKDTPEPSSPDLGDAA